MGRVCCVDLLGVCVPYGKKVDDESVEDEQLRRAQKCNDLVAWIFTGLTIWFLILVAQNKISSLYTTDTVMLVWNNSVTPLVPVPTDATLQTCVNRPQPTTVSWGGSGARSFRAELRQQWFPTQTLFLIIFLGGTALANLIRSLNWIPYASMIADNAPRLDRWVEYGITSGAMIVVIGNAFGISNVWVLLLLAVLQSSLCIFGYMVEVMQYGLVSSLKVIRNESTPIAKMVSEEEEEEDPNAIPTVSKEYVGLIAGRPSKQGNLKQAVRLNIPFSTVPPRPILMRAASSRSDLPTVQTTLGDKMDYAMLHNPLTQLFYNGKSWMFLTGIFIHLAIWGTLGFNLFGNTIKTFDCLNHNSSYTVIPIIIYFSEAGFFTSFALAQGYLIWVRDAREYKLDGIVTEYMYTFLSLTSKVNLSVLLLIQAYTKKTGA